jgi:hypothetical protein
MDISPVAPSIPGPIKLLVNYYPMDITGFPSQMYQFDFKVIPKGRMVKPPNKVMMKKIFDEWRLNYQKANSNSITLNDILYDGFNNIYCTQSLRIDKRGKDFQLSLDRNNYGITIKLVSELKPLENLQKFMKKEIHELPQLEINVLDIVLRQNLYKNYIACTVRSFDNLKNDPVLKAIQELHNSL